jgi:hypothetical protein
LGNDERKKENGVAEVDPTKPQKPWVEKPWVVWLPGQQEDLAKHAEGKSADADVLSFLRDLPDRDYEIPADVNKEMS